MTELVQKLIFISSMANRDLPDHVLKIFATTLLKKLSLDEALRACDLWIEDSKTSFMPTPAQIISLIRPKPTDRDDANVIAHKLNAIVLKRGSLWADEPVFMNGEFKFMGPVGFYFDSWDEACIALVGEAGHAVVEKMGGWKMLATAFFETDNGIVRAQVRDLAEACIHHARNGTLDSNIKLPASMSMISKVCEKLDLNKAIERDFGDLSDEKIFELKKQKALIELERTK